MSTTSSSTDGSSIAITVIEAVMAQGPLGVALMVALVLGLAALVIWGLVKIVECPNTEGLLQLVLRARGLIQEPSKKRDKRCHHKKRRK